MVGLPPGPAPRQDGVALGKDHLAGERLLRCGRAEGHERLFSGRQPQCDVRGADVDGMAALEASGCPVCQMVQQAGRHFLFHVLREGKAHAEVYERVREAGGFCEEHTHLLRRLGATRLGDRRSLARLYGWLLDDLASDLTPPSPCPACDAAADFERASLAALRDLLHPVTGDADLRKRFTDGTGLCLNHFVAAAARIEDGESLRILTDVQARAWEALSRDLKEYLRKHDYRFSHEPKTPAEARSPPSVAPPWRMRSWRCRSPTLFQSRRLQRRSPPTPGFPHGSAKLLHRLVPHDAAIWSCG